MDSSDQRIKSGRKISKKDDLIKTSFTDYHQKFCIKNSQSSRLIRLTCEGNLHDKNFPSKLKNIVSKLRIILSNGKNLIKVTKVEPWNSVRVTLNLSDDAAQQLRHLAEHGDENLREIGILSVQLDGQQVISLNLPNSNITTTNIQHNNNNERRSIQNNNNNDDDNQNNNINNNKIGEDFDGNSPRQIKETESLDRHHHHPTKYQQFDRINGAAIDENSDRCSITTNASTSFEPGGGGNTLSSMMVVVMNDDSKNVPGNPPTNSSYTTNQKSSNLESTSAPASMDCTDEISHHFGSHQQHKISSLNTFVKNESLVNYVNSSSNDNNNNNNNNHQNTSDIQNSWHNPATIKDTTESTINPCLSSLRISCQPSNIASTDMIPEKFQTNSSSSSSSASASANTMLASNLIRTNMESNQQQQQPPGNNATMIAMNQMQSQSTTNALSSQKSVPTVVSSFKMHQTMVKQESTSDSVVSICQAESNVDNLRNDTQLLHQIKSSNSQYQPQQQQQQPTAQQQLKISQQKGPQQQQQQQNILSNQKQTNVATNNSSSSDILGSSVDAVDDDLLNSVVTASGADPNDFTTNDLSDLSWLEIDNTTNNSTNRSLNQQQTSTTTISSSSGSSTTTASSSGSSAISSKSPISIQMNSQSTMVATGAINVARIQQDNKTTSSNLMSVPMNSLPYFLQQQQQQQKSSQQQHQQQQQFSTKMVNTLPTNVMGSNQSILINTTNPNQSTVLTSSASASSTNNTNINCNNSNSNQSSISTGTSTTTIFPFTSLQNSGIRLQQQQQPPMSSSSPRHIYVPARTQQSWPTANTGSPQQQQQQQQQSSQQQTPPSTPPTVNNQKRYNQQQQQQQQQQASTPTSDVMNITQSQAQQHQQQPPTRFVTINSNGNGSLVRQQQQQSSATQLSLANQINNNNNNNGTLVQTQTQVQNKPQQMNQSQQIVVRTSGNSGTGGGGSFSNNQQQQQQQQQQSQQSSNMNNNNGGAQQQNAVALSSPLLVNLLQSDVTSPFQQPLLNSAGGGNGGGGGLSQQQQQQQQQQQFLNQSGQTRQIRFITHGSNDHSEGSTPVMMMVQVSSSGHQGTQLINPVTANMVQVAKTSSNVQQQQQQRSIEQQQRSIEQQSSHLMTSSGQSNNNDGNMVTTTNTKPAKKPRKPRKSKNQTENRMADSSVQTSGSGGDCLSGNVSHPSQTPTNFVTMTNIGSIPITSNTDMSARIQTSSVSTFITVPTSSMAQSIVKLQQQTISSNNGGGGVNVQQSILSSPNSGGGGGSGSHAIFNQKSRVQPVVMIAANSMDASNSSVASQAPTIVSSAGGTFILANMNSLNAAVNSSSPITSATATTSGGVQMSGARKQIFLATKSNSFPVSSALSAGSIVARFANNPSSSSTPTLVSSPVKLVAQQQQQQQQQQSSNNNSLTMSPNELRNMSAPATPQQQQQQASLLSTPMKSSPSPVMASPIQTSSLPINANMIPNSPSSLSSSSTSSTSSQATNNSSNLYPNSSSSSSSSNNNNNMLQTLNTVVSMASSSPMKNSAKSSHNSEQYLLAPSPSSNSNSSSNSQQQQPQQQQQSTGSPQFKNFQIPKATPTSLLLNKLNQTNQQQQQQILAAISTGNMSANACGKISQQQFKQVSNVPKQFLQHPSGGNNDDHSANNQVAMENSSSSFVVKQIQTSLAGATMVASQVPNLVVDNSDNRMQHPNQKNPETFVQVTGQHNQKHIVNSSNSLNSISNFKQSLADMLAANNPGENSASSDRIVSGFSENPDPDKISSEPTAPISPSYFLAPASAFDIQTKCEQKPTEIKNEQQLVGQDGGLVEPKTMDPVEPNEAKDNTSDPSKSNITSKTFSLTAIVTSCAGTVTTATISPLITATGLDGIGPFIASRTEQNITATTSSKKNYDSFDGSEDLPDNILDDDDDEDDGSDSDDDEFCFFPKRKSHFLSGSIGSIGGSNSNTNTPKKSEPNAEQAPPPPPASISSGLSQKLYQSTNPTKDPTEPMSQVSSSMVTKVDSSTIEETMGKEEKSSTVKMETLLEKMKTEEGSSTMIQSNPMTNGDLSQESGSSSNPPDEPDSKHQEIKHSQTIVAALLPPLLPPGASACSSCQMPIITPIMAKSETITKTTVDQTPSSSSNNDLVKPSSETSSTMPMLNESTNKVTATGSAGKKRRISPPTGGTTAKAKPGRRKTISSLEKSVSVPTTTPTKIGQQMFIGTTSNETLKMTSSNPTEKCPTLVHNEITNNNESANKKSLFILKHPQTISAAGGIQLSNTNQTLAQYLQADGSTISTNPPASGIAAVATSSSSPSSTPSPSPSPASSTVASSTNQKLKLVCFGPNKYISIQPNPSVQGGISESNSSGVLYRVPGPGKQFVVLKQMMVNDSGNTIKLISSNPNLKLPTSVGAAAGQGTSQSVFIPMVPTTASSNSASNNLLSVKPTTATTTTSVAQIVTTNDPVLSVGNSSQANVMVEATGDTRLVTKKMQVVRSGSLPNVPLVAPGTASLNEKPSIKSMENEMFNTNDTNETGNVTAVRNDNRNPQILALFDTKNVSTVDSNKDTTMPEHSSSRMDENAEGSASSSGTNQVDSSQEDSDRMKKSEINQNDPAKNASVKQLKENTNTLTSTMTTIPRTTVHIISRTSNNDLAAGASSNLMILKADGTRIPATTAADSKDLTGLGRSNSPNAGGLARRPILITKSVPYNPLNIQQTSSSMPHQQQQTQDGGGGGGGPSTSMAIFATKSNNTITATKTLPTILRQSKRKNDYVHSSSGSSGSVVTTMEPPAAAGTIKNIFDSSGGGGGNDSSEAESSESGKAFRQQQQQKFPAFTSNDNESMPVVSGDPTPARPKKRARKSKVTSLPQALIGDNRMFLNVDQMSLDQESASQGHDDNNNNNEPETTGNSRVLRNSISLPSFPKPKSTPKQRVPRNTNNKTQQQSSAATTTSTPSNAVQFIQNDTIQTFLTRANEQPTMVIKSNEKTKKVRKVNTTTPRPTRSNRGRAKKQPELSAAATTTTADNQMVDTIPAEAFVSSSTSLSSPLSSSSSGGDPVAEHHQTGGGGNLLGKNMLLSTIITQDGTLITRPANCVRAGQMSSFVPAQQINVLPVSNTAGGGVAAGGEHFVSLLDSNINNNNSPTNNGGNNSLLVKRPRKSPAQQQQQQPTASSSAIRPSLRNIVATETGSASGQTTSTAATGGTTSAPPSTPSPNKRRRLAKDISK